MARLQYQPATRPRGFQPIQLSRAGIARMEEESNRIIRGMERQRDAEIRQRESNLQDMKENSEYERRARERNQDIENRNFENEQLAIKNQAKSRQAQAQADEQAFKSTVGALVDFSVTAGKVAAERTKQMIIDQTEEGRQARLTEYRNNPQIQNDFNITESQIGIETVKYDNDSKLAEAKGLETSNETSKSLLANPGRGYYWQKGYYNQLVKEQTPLLLNRAFQGTEALFTDAVGNQFSGIEAVNSPERTTIVLDTVLKSLYGSTGLNISELEPGFLADSNDAVDKIRSAYIQRSIEGETKQNYEILTVKGQDLRDSGEIVQAYLLDLKNPLLGREKALQNVFDLYSARNADGSLRYSKEYLDNLNLLGDGTILETRGNSSRYMEAQRTRVQTITDDMREDQARSRVEAKDFAASAVPKMQAYFDNADPEGDLEGAATFEKGFYERFPNGSLPQRYLDAKKSALQGNKKTELSLIAQQYTNKTIDPAFIESIQDPQNKIQAIDLYKKQEIEKYGPTYAETRKLLVADAKALTKFQPTTEGMDSTTLYVKKSLENEYKFFFKTLIDKGVPPEVASKEAYTQLQAYVAKGVAGDKQNKFYFETGPNNSIVFPNIQGTATQLSVAAQERRNELNKLLTQDDTGLFSKPNSILSEQEIETSIGSYYANNGTFKIPVNVEYTAKILGVSPIAAINAQIEASNTKYGLNRRLLMPTPAEEAVFDQVPSVQKLFTDWTKASKARFNRGTAIVTGTTGPMRASMTGTGVAPVEQTNALVEVAGELGVSPIDLATIIGFETGGTYDPGIVGGEGGNYQGLIQFGGPERAAYGVVPGMSFEEQLRGPVKRFFQDRFKSVGMSTQGASLEDLYTTVLAGNPKANRDSRDSFGTSARSGVAKMGPHRERAMQLFGFSQN